MATVTPSPLIAVPLETKGWGGFYFYSHSDNPAPLFPLRCSREPSLWHLFKNKPRRIPRPTVGGVEADTRCHKPPIINNLYRLLKTVADDDYLRRTAITRPILTDEQQD
jgi:hypothetical protein